MDALRSALSGCPCPRWDVETDHRGIGAWWCVSFDEVVTPMWVAIDEQEPSLRRAARQRSAHHVSRR